MGREPRLSRRRVLQRAGTTAALAALGPLWGCGGKKSEGGRDAKQAGDPCADVTGLTPDEKSFREDAGYLSETPIPGERCDNCELWRPPEGGAVCGGCTVIGGPIHPGGYCDLWEARS